MNLAIITNPNSRGNRAGPAWWGELVERHPEWHWFDTPTAEALPDALDEAMGRNPDVLAISGGDGTVQEALSQLRLKLSEQNLPVLAILPGGTTNMTADDINGKGASYRKAARRLEAFAENDRWREVPVVERPMVLVRDGERERCGFFFGIGAVVNGIEYCHERVYAMGITGASAPGVALLRAAYGIATREPRFSEAVPLELEAAGDKRTVLTNMLLASTLERLFLGIHPFWPEGEGALQTLWVADHPRHFLRGLPRLVTGRRGGVLVPENGYRSCSRQALQIGAAGRFTIDGEFFDIDSDGLLVTTTAPLRFLPLGDAR